MAMNNGQANEDTAMIHSSSKANSTMDVIQPEMVCVLAAKSEAERLQIAWGMCRSAYRMVQRIIAMELPDLSAEEQQHVVARRMSNGTCRSAVEFQSCPIANQQARSGRLAGALDKERFVKLIYQFFFSFETMD